MKKYLRITILTSILAVLLVILAVIATDPADNFSLVETEIIADTTGQAFITVGLQNNTNQSYYHVQIDVLLKNGDGNIVGGITASTTDLAAGGVWYFDADLPDEAVVFQLKNMRCSPRPNSSERTIRRSGWLEFQAIID